MGTYKNGYYNDPGIASAVGNLAQLFAPPGGADMAGYATAQAKRAEAQRLADYYTKAQDPRVTREELDRLGIGAGVFSPNQSHYTVDQGNQVLRDNNAADNTRALEQTRLNNATELQKTGMSTRGSLVGQLYGPLNQGQIRPAVPAAVAGMFSLPEIAQADGAPKPLSESEVKGGFLQNLPAAEQRAVALEGVPVEQIVMDGKPQIVFRNDAVGKTPYDKPSGGPELANYVTPDGRSGTATFDAAQGGWKDTQTGASLPEGSRTAKAVVQGSSGDVLGPTTANNTESNRLSATLDSAERAVTDYENLLKANPGVAGAPGAIRGVTQNLAAATGELISAFGDKAPGAAVTLGEIQSNLNRLSPNYDPNIQKAQTKLAELAYMWAQIQNPSGEVSRQAYERAIEALSGGYFSNNQSALAGMQGMRDMIANQRLKVQSMRSPSAASVPPPADPGVAEKWERDPSTGQLRRAQ